MDASFSAPVMSYDGGGPIVGAATIDEMSLQADGKIIISGSFNRIGGTVIPENVGRLFPDGSMDVGFAVGLGADSEVDAAAVGQAEAMTMRRQWSPTERSISRPHRG